MSLRRLAGDNAELGQRQDDHSFEVAKEAGVVADWNPAGGVEMAERHNQVGDELPRPMIGDLASPVRRMDFDCACSQRLFVPQQVGTEGSAAQREDVGVFQQEQCGGNVGRDESLRQHVLDVARLREWHTSQGQDLGGVPAILGGALRCEAMIAGHRTCNLTMSLAGE